MAVMTVHLGLDNAAFDREHGGPEVARIFRMLAEDAECDGLEGPLRGHETRGIFDVNGNRIGTVTITGRD